MAKRRMFLENLIESDEFCDLPHAAQVLYLHMNMSADDDGLIGNVTRILRSLRITKKNLELLCERGYVILFDSGVAAIVHWLSHNRIKKDRYTPSRFRDEISALKTVDDAIYVRAHESTDGADSEQKCSVSAPQVSIVKDSIVKDSIVKDSIVKDSSVKDSSVKDSSVESSKAQGRIEEESQDNGSVLKEKSSVHTNESVKSEIKFADFLKNVEKYFIKKYTTVTEARAFKSYYEKRGWKSEEGTLIFGDHERYIDEWMKNKKGAPVGTPL